MATLKFNYGGTDYKLVAKDTKITTPSIKVGNLYIPCFKGNIGEEVTYGDKIYTLSPLKVGDCRSVCSEKDAFDGRVIVSIVTQGLGLEDTGLGNVEYKIKLTGAYTPQNKELYTVELGSDCYQHHYTGFGFNMNSDPISTTYTVKNKNNEIIKQGNFSFVFYLSSAQPYLVVGNDIRFAEYDVLKNTSYYTGKQASTYDVSLLTYTGKPYF